MKKRMVIPSLLICGAAAFAQDPPSRVARLNLLSGPVSFEPAGLDQWTAATLNYPMTTGDHLYTDEGARAEMHIGSSAIRLNARTAMSFLNLDARTVQIRNTEGGLNLRVRHLDESEVYEVDTPNGAISLLRTGEYRIDTDPERNATMLTVWGGEAEVTANGSSFIIHPRQTAYFTGDGSAEEVRDANRRDEFDNFCSQRDRREDQAPPPRYVTREMVGYEDLDANGVWQTYPEYGAVWVPRVAVGWAPYRFGHWAWVEPWGWTWIDDAPWGFAPFHYGRWAFIAGGWGWIPGPVAVRPVYAPALVAFVGDSNWSVSLRFGGGGGVAWFPLGPREVYYPAYHVSNTYVRQMNVTNVTNITNITNVNTTNIRYVNQSVPGAVTAVSRQDFAAARPVHQAAIAVPASAIANAPVTGTAPAVAPRQESMLARPANQSGPVAQPRAALWNRPVVAKAPPPPPPVPFNMRQQALAANPGRPVDPSTMQSLRTRTFGDVAGQYPLVRSAQAPSGLPATPRPVQTQTPIMQAPPSQPAMRPQDRPVRPPNPDRPPVEDLNRQREQMRIQQQRQEQQRIQRPEPRLEQRPAPQVQRETPAAQKPQEVKHEEKSKEKPKDERERKQDR